MRKVMNFSLIELNEGLKNRLVQSVSQNRIAHAQLLSGDSTSGALPVAIAYARYVLCPNRGVSDPCEVCSTCYNTKRLEHPDLHFIFPVNKSKLSKAVAGSSNDKPISDHFIHLWREFVMETSGVFTEMEWYEKIGIENQQSNISREDASELLRKMSLKSFEGGYKIVIIYLPEKMHTTAANALLKLVEEPPSQTLFLFVSENPDSVITTIRSRTQPIALPPRGVQLLKNDEYFHLFGSLMRLGYGAKFTELMDWAEETATLGREPLKGFMNYSIALLRECYVIGIGVGELSQLDGAERGFAQKFAPYVNHITIEPLVKEFQRAAAQIKQNGDAKIVLSDFALQISKIIINGKRATVAGQ